MMRNSTLKCYVLTWMMHASGPLFLPVAPNGDPFWAPVLTRRACKCIVLVFCSNLSCWLMHSSGMHAVLICRVGWFTLQGCWLLLLTCLATLFNLMYCVLPSGQLFWFAQLAMTSLMLYGLLMNPSLWAAILTCKTRWCTLWGIGLTCQTDVCTFLC